VKGKKRADVRKLTSIERYIFEIENLLLAIISTQP